MQRVIDNFWATVSGAVPTVITYLIGGWDSMLQLLAFLILFNFLTGWTAAIKRKKYDEDKIISGLIKIGVVLMVIIVANRADYVTPDYTGRLRYAVIVIANVYYAQSFFKNTAKLGFPLPQWFIDAVAEPMKKR